MTHVVTDESDIEALDMKCEPSDQNDTPEATAGIRSVEEIQPIRFYAAQPIAYVVEGMIAAGTITAITGDSGSGKSTLAMAIANAVSKGIPFAGLATIKCRVLVLDRENPRDVVAERMQRLGIEDGPDFIVWGGWCPEEAPSPWSSRIEEYVRQTAPVIIVDSFIAFYDGDENDASQMRAFMRGLRRLADLGATVVLLHHSGKNDSNYRGSTDFKAAIDIGFKLFNFGDPSRLTNLRLKAFKPRFEVLRQIVLNCRGGRFESDQKPVACTTEVTVKQIIMSNPGIKTKEFENSAAAKGIARNQARGWLDDAVKRHLVRVETGLHNARFHYWAESSEPPA